MITSQQPSTFEVAVLFSHRLPFTVLPSHVCIFAAITIRPQQTVTIPQPLFVLPSPLFDSLLHTSLSQPPFYIFVNFHRHSLPSPYAFTLCLRLMPSPYACAFCLLLPPSPSAFAIRLLPLPSAFALCLHPLPLPSDFAIRHRPPPFPSSLHIHPLP